MHDVGDVMYDASLFALKQPPRTSIVHDLQLQPGKYAVATVHRAENTDDPIKLKSIINYLVECGREAPIVLPLHPRTRRAAERMRSPSKGLLVIEPLGYLDMAWLLSGACGIYTDWRAQKEAYFHRVPCVTLRSRPNGLKRSEMAGTGSGHSRTICHGEKFPNMAMAGQVKRLSIF